MGWVQKEPESQAEGTANSNAQTKASGDDTHVESRHSEAEAGRPRAGPQRGLHSEILTGGVGGGQRMKK